jgi:phosphoglycolate phosphatase-like HAD superfamily hydrolase
MHLSHLAFDMDGVIYSAENFIGNAYFKAIKSSGLNLPVPSTAQIMAQIGKPIREIFSNIFPGITGEEMAQLRNYTRKFVVQMVYEKKGIVYHGIPELIKTLSAEYTLAACSNGGGRYVGAILKTYELDKYFIPVLTLESENSIHKGELLKSYISKNGNDSSAWVMIGDRKPDLDAAEFNNCLFIGCTWGRVYGSELTGADFIVKAPSEIISILSSINKN